MNNNIEISNSFYKNRHLDNNFINSIYSLDIAVELYFASLFFNNDLTRIVYSSNEYCFRKRANQSDKSETPVWNNVNLPFFNYYLTGTSDPTSRPWYSHYALINGIYIDELGFNIQINPVKFTYEATIWFSTDYDMKYALIPLYRDNNTESKIQFDVQVDNQTLSCLGINHYSITYNPAYKESDWLEKNKIRSISLDFNIDTFLLQGEHDVSLVREIIFDFLSTKKDMADITIDDFTGSLNKEITEYFSD